MDFTSTNAISTANRIIAAVSWLSSDNQHILAVVNLCNLVVTGNPPQKKDWENLAEIAKKDGIEATMGSSFDDEDYIERAAFHECCEVVIKACEIMSNPYATEDMVADFESWASEF